MSKAQYSFTPEEIAAVQQFRSKVEQSASPKVNPEWLLVAQLGRYFGWETVEAFKNKKLRLETALMMVEGVKVIEARRTVDMANAMRAALTSVHSKDADGVFNKLLNPYLDLLSQDDD